MPDKWEYPWYAAWDLAFHCVALAHVDPEFAKEQLVLLCREWYMHPNGQLPAYEWAFGDVNPPVHAWAALRVFEIDGDEDYDFLERVFHKLLLNFTWWVNRKDSEGNNVFEGGFLGLDNIGPFDRSALPVGGRLEQSDGTAWMAMYCQNLLEIALILAEHDATYEDVATKFFEHFALIASALNDKGLWDEEDGFYYDVLHLGDGDAMPLRARSIVGLLPLAAVTTLGPATMARLPDFSARVEWFTANRPEGRDVVQHMESDDARRLAACSRSSTPERLRRILARDARPGTSSSPTTASARSRATTPTHPLEVAVDGVTATLDYEPGESTSGLFGGNSNWRGPGLVPDQLPADRGAARLPPLPRRRLPGRVPDRLAARTLTSAQVADELAARLTASSCAARTAARPVFGGYELFQRRPGVARPDPVPRVLPRRHRRRPRRLAPDRLDRARRRPDHPARPAVSIRRPRRAGWRARRARRRAAPRPAGRSRAATGAPRSAPRRRRRPRASPRGGVRGRARSCRRRVWVAAPPPAMIASTKCEVAVARWVGKPRARTSSGTWMTPPPMPRKLETKPTPTSTATPGARERRSCTSSVAIGELRWLEPPLPPETARVHQ